MPARPARTAEMLADRLNQVDDGKGAAPVQLVLVDLDHEPALDLIAQARAFSATLPVIAFGSHVAVERLRAAEAAGASQVMPRSRFVAELRSLAEAAAEAASREER